MIVCENCGATDDDAMDMMQTIYAKHHRIKNHACKQCGRLELVTIDFMGCIIILDERDEEDSSIIAL